MAESWQVEEVAYEVYLKATQWKPTLGEDLSLAESIIILNGRCLSPKKLDIRVVPGTRIPGRFQELQGYYTVFLRDKGLPVVRDILGDSVSLQFQVLTKFVNPSLNGLTQDFC